MIEDLNDKLSKELDKSITEESQVVYILSCIRKIIEMEGKPKRNQNRKLKFYCDWALHSRIDDIAVFEKEIVKMSRGDLNAGAEVMASPHFLLEFQKFIVDHDLPQQIFTKSENIDKFNYLLFNVYKDVPIVVKDIKETHIKITNVVSSPQLQIGVQIINK